MSRFVICGDWVLDPKVGVQRYAAQLLRELALRVKAGRTPHRFELLVPEEAEQIPTLSAIPAVRRGSAASKLSRYFWQQKVFPAYARVSHAMGIDLALALPVRGCRVSAVHDCIVESFPENFSDHRLYALSYRIRVHAATSDPDRVILTVSETSRKEIERRYPKSRGRIRVVSDGWEHMQRIEEDDSVFRRLGIDPAQPYFFSLGSRYRHKNIEWVLGAAVRNPHALFVITGANLDHKEQERLDGARRSNVRFTGYVSDAEMKALMKNSRALIQPSLYEGFAIPPLEALSLGTPVILSRTSCLPEIYGSAAHYIDPMNSDCDLDALLREPVESAAPVLSRYTWSNACEKLLGVLDSLNGEM